MKYTLKVNFTKYAVQFDAITMVLSYKHDERWHNHTLIGQN